nr:hypothetical protein [Tanacetum cinerariifolium]
MSSPNHPTSDIKNAFSSNSPDYTLVSPNYFTASPRNTSYGLFPIASPTLLLFHDDPYMKGMHAYDAIIPPQVPIAPSTILLPSPVLPLSLMFDPLDFFLPKDILPPRKQAYFLSLSFTNLSGQPQAFDIREDIQVRHQSDIKSLFGYNP